MNTRRARTMVGSLVVGAVLLGGCSVSSQELASRSAAPFRVESSAAKDRRGNTKISGYIYNSYGYNAGNFQLLVVGVDEGGQVISKRVVPILGTVSPVGRMYFEIPAPGLAASYQVSVYFFDWIARGV